MSSNSEEIPPLDDVTEINDETQRRSKILYTRDFLLSFSDLDSCKKLPSGFDQALLSDLVDSTQERNKTSGGLPLNSIRRSEYGSSPPTRGDSSSYSRVIQGRWESRSSGRNDRDSDTQSDWEPDSSRRYGNQPKRSWQGPEHDGLLGSGSFPRPSGYAAGASAPKARQNEPYQLNRSSEPYQPPRPYKAAPHSRRDTDAFNNETFGSSECNSEDRAEEERKRRASFDLMRKEQHKSFQDRQNSNLEKKDDFDILTLAEECKDDLRSLKRGSESEDVEVPLAKDTVAEKFSAPLQTSASRPLVPPGFASAAVDRSSGAKSLIHSHTEEVGSGESEDSHILLGKRNPVVHTTPDDQEGTLLAREMGFMKPQIISTHALTNDQSAAKSSGAVELIAEKVIGPSILGDSNQDHSTSILDKLTNSSLPMNDAGSSAVVHHHSQVEETRDFQSSKFAFWFNEEDKKPGNKDQVSGQPNDLLLLIVGEKGGTRVLGKKSQKGSPSLPFSDSESGERLVTDDVVSATVGCYSQLRMDNKPEPVSAVLTCEDLEQSILSEVTVDSSISQPPVQNWTNNSNKKSVQPKSSTDNLASQHLLSLLQKGPSLKDTESSSNIGLSFSGNVQGFEEPNISAFQATREAKVKSTSNSSLTLETLFGSAFMKELQSVGAPVSSHRGPPTGSTQLDVSEPHGVPFPATNNQEPGFSSKILNGGGDLTANKRKQVDNKIDEPWLNFDDLQAELNSSQLRTNYGHRISGFNAPSDVCLPEEDNLISASNNRTLDNLLPPGSAISNTQMDFAEKLGGAFNSGFRDERPIRGAQELPFHRGPYDMREPSHPYQNSGSYDMREPSHPYQNPNVQLPFAQLHHQQLNNLGSPLPHLDSRPMNINSHHEAVPNHQMQMNMLRPPFRHPSSGFDQPIPHALLQQMQMQGNFPPNMLHGQSLPQIPNRSAPMPAHSNFSNLGMSPPAHEIVGGSSHHPEALQRLIEMELRSKPKQIHPLANSGSGGQSHNRMYGHELDMGFGFR